MKYRFKVPYKNFMPGDLVPETYDAGVVQTMLQYQRIEPAETKQVVRPPEDKMLKPQKVKTK